MEEWSSKPDKKEAKEYGEQTVPVIDTKNISTLIYIFSGQNTKVPFLRIQVERLFESTSQLWLEPPVSVGQVRPRG